MQPSRNSETLDTLDWPAHRAPSGWQRYLPGRHGLMLMVVVGLFVGLHIYQQPVAMGGGGQSDQTSFWTYLNRYKMEFLRGTMWTVIISIASMAIASTLGLLLALCRVYGNFVLSRFALLYVEVVRGTPLLVQLYLIYYGLPTIPVVGEHLKISAIVAAIIGIGLNYAAYEAEIYRAGIMAIPRQQSEAALALGLTRQQTIRRVILPQALRLVVPPVTNDFVALFKDTSIVSILAITELTMTFRSASISTGRYLEFALVTALIYFLLAFPLSKLARRLERRIHPHHDSGSQPL